MLTVSMIYPGAGASEVETSVTKKLEDALVLEWVTDFKNKSSKCYQKKMFVVLKNVVSLSPCDYPASRQNSAQRVILLFFIPMSKVPYSKPFLSYSAQLAFLKSCGMTFTDENKALHLLENISFHRFSDYWYPLLADKQNHAFKQCATFEMAFSLYKFDRELRKLVSSELEKIEVVRDI